MKVRDLKELINNLDDDVEVLGVGVVESGYSVSSTVTPEVEVDLHDSFEYTNEDEVIELENVLVIRVSGYQTSCE